MNNPFLNDDDFFKSKQLNKHGNIEDLQKSIPTMPKKEIIQPNIAATPIEKQKVPKEITQFKTKVENMFKELDGIMEDLVKQKGIDSSKYIVNKYSEFKSEFQYCVNDLINYPKKETKNDPWNKTRVVIRK